MLQLQHPEFLLALTALVIPVALYLLVLRWKKKTIRKIGDEKLVKQLVKDYSPQRFFLKFALLLAVIALLVLAVANPRTPNGSTNVSRSGIDVMIALDVSKSMLAQDIKPDRLTRAKQLISRLIDKLADDRIGIVVFAGKAYLQMPLTTDHTAAKMYLSTASPEVVPTQGTVIADALKMCYAAFNSKEKKYRSVVLISDGEDHDENAIKTAKAMSDEGVMINTIGVGSPEGSMIIDAATNEAKKDASGNFVITKLNEDELRNVAATGNGLYQLLNSADEAAENLNAQLKKMGSRSIKDNSSTVYQNYFQWIIALALIFLLIEFITGEKTKAKLVGKIKQAKAVTLAILFLMPLSVFAQDGEKQIKKGNEAYAAKKFDVAAGEYKKVADKDPSSEKASFNLGNALYKSGKNEEALQAYDAAINNSKVAGNKSAAYYNKGVVLQNDKRLPECIDAYKNALRLNPSDEEARLNLQKALIKQQQQQNENKKKQDQKQQQEKQQKEQPKPQPKISKKEAEEKLKALLQHEKNLQDKLRKADAASPEKPEKDW